MLDNFETHTLGLTAPAQNGFEIIPADGADIAEVTRAIYVGGGGDVRLTLRSGATVTFTGLSAGTLLPVRARQVAATGTTATGLVGLA